MKRLSTGVLAVLFAAGLGLNAIAAPSNHATAGNLGSNAVAADDAAGATQAANFGSPPSGQIPILYNDQHVYSKPDKLKAGRVLAALVRGGTILIPLRSMFEQMGATVAYDAASKTVDVTKPGADVKVTVGKSEVVINGESRPLDVPPEIYQGTVVVPVRVISEGMGAYVQWVPEKRLVVVRYLPPTPPPTPAPTESPAPVVPPTPTPEPVATPYKDLFIAGDYLVSPKVYDEFSPGNTGSNTNGFSYAIRGGAEFDAAGLPWMLEGDYRQINYPHSTPNFSGACPGDPGCVTVIGGSGGQTFIPSMIVRDYDLDVRLGLKVADPRIFVGVGYMFRANNVGYPKRNAFGFGVEKLADLDKPFSIYGSVWYYPNVRGVCGIDVCPTGPFTLSYNTIKYQLGGTFTFGPQTPLFLDFGFLGSTDKNQNAAPSDRSQSALYAGLGLKF